MTQPTIALTLEEAKTQLQAANERNKAQEEVLQQYITELRDLQDRVKVAEGAARGNKSLLATNKQLKNDLGMYQALIKGWPKGRKLVKLMTRDPYDY